MAGLDNYYRYIEKNGTTTLAPTPGTNGNGADTHHADEHDGILSPNGATALNGKPASARVRYVLRGGVTVAEAPQGSETGEVGKAIEATPIKNVARKPAPMNNGKNKDGFEEGISLADGPPSWQRLPRHILLLARLPEEPEVEVAAKYYSRGFKESRQQLIERLLDPTLTLEETARVLGVCPATVRRYTNRELLPHYRTVGQQRRFRLSDVLAFLEKHQTEGAKKTARTIGTGDAV